MLLPFRQGTRHKSNSFFLKKNKNIFNWFCITCFSWIMSLSRHKAHLFFRQLNTAKKKKLFEAVQVLQLLSKHFKCMLHTFATFFLSCSNFYKHCIDFKYIFIDILKSFFLCVIFFAAVQINVHSFVNLDIFALKTKFNKRNGRKEHQK